MDNKIENLIRDLARRSTGADDAVRYEQFGERRCLESDSFCEIPLGQDWLFDKASDAEAEVLLKIFVANELDVGPGLNCEMAHLLSGKGNLVLAQLAKKIDGIDWSSYGSQCLLLAGLHFLPEWRRRAKDLLALVPEDIRDGLFLSIWKAEDEMLNCALLECFEKWACESEWGNASGEHRWLERFLGKWIAKEVFSYERLENLITWHFKREFCRL